MQLSSVEKKIRALRKSIVNSSAMNSFSNFKTLKEQDDKLSGWSGMGFESPHVSYEVSKRNPRAPLVQEMQLDSNKCEHAIEFEKKTTEKAQDCESKRVKEQDKIDQAVASMQPVMLEIRNKVSALEQKAEEDASRISQMDAKRLSYSDLNIVYRDTYEVPQKFNPASALKLDLRKDQDVSFMKSLEGATLPDLREILIENAVYRPHVVKAFLLNTRFQSVSTFILSGDESHKSEQTSSYPEGLLRAAEAATECFSLRNFYIQRTEFLNRLVRAARGARELVLERCCYNLEGDCHFGDEEFRLAKINFGSSMSKKKLGMVLKGIERSRLQAALKEVKVA